MINPIFSKKGKFIIFKHSTTCPISEAAKSEVDKYVEDPKHLEVITIDVHTQKELKMEIAEKYGVKHESPQILLIEDQKCTDNFSHEMVKLKRLKKL